MTTVNSIRSLTVDLPPSCVAFCPLEPEYFIVGTYFLHPKADDRDRNAIGAVATSHESIDDASEEDTEEETQKRTGSLLLYQLIGDEIHHISTEELPAAVLDVQWNASSEVVGALGSPLLAVATSTGVLAFYGLRSQHGNTRLQHCCTKRVCDKQILVLSLQWHPSLAGVIGFTLSDGRVCVSQIKLSEYGEAAAWNDIDSVTIIEVASHELEAWTLSFTLPAPLSSTSAAAGDGSDRLLSGGDDLALRCTDIQDLSNPAARWQDRKVHQAGVTAILPLPLPGDLIVTGSYDDHIRLIAAPVTGRRCRVLTEMKLGGGVWRLKLLAKQQSSSSASPMAFVILASCMHAGTRVVQLICRNDGGSKTSSTSEPESCVATGDVDGTWEFRILATFEEHKSMNYGSDVQPQVGGEGSVRTIISTSFYDKLLCLWRVDLKGG